MRMKYLLSVEAKEFSAAGLLFSGIFSLGPFLPARCAQVGEPELSEQRGGTTAPLIMT
jgi:hypothetical protein